jgi:ribonuclease HII|tara:strand:+ start:194 stop:793 length:600 start_codon:yes stop_codon:yes gene_type:complete
MGLKLSFSGSLEAGIDEAGRGSLAGPVTAAAVILPDNFNSEILDDSKKISKLKRNKLRKIIEKEAVAFSVINIESKIIDEINILNATIKAMHLAIQNLKVIPKHLLIDGNFFYDYKNIPHTCIIKGDGKYQNIAAASILAKTYRDDHMLNLNKINCNYGWNKNKGYGTKKHRKAIKNYGITKFHRKSFQLLKKQLLLNL